jgi:hypothetical protein
MSIWGSGDIAGVDENNKHDGSVVSYIDGWSNHYPGDFPPLGIEVRQRSPANDLTEETPASIGTGWLPPWCVPGHEQQAEIDGLDVDTHLGPWLRLDITMRTVSIWGGVEIGNQDVHSVCLNEKAVTALRDNLNEWLAREKLHPVPLESTT